MSTITVLHYDAFSTIPHKGNPAGIVLDADGLSEQDMQRIAKQVGFNETTFILHSDQADVRLRYFTPGQEMNLCGHATIASLYCLHSKGFFGEKTHINIETKASILPIEFTLHEGQLFIKMKQNKSEFIPFQGNIARLAEAIGLQAEDIDMTTPIVYGSTGVWTLLVPIKSLEKCKTMKPMNAMFPSIMTEFPRASVHPFCMETYHSESFMHGRHFSSPYSGMEEDPVTGTASGVMGAYYLQYMQTDQDAADFYIEQGQEIDRDGRVKVRAMRNEDRIEVFIEGTAVFVREIEVEHEPSTVIDH
ncbi:PhzF family phenazine biosynthesis protein [Paenibacillus alvei]|uniref:PhzF family phenazine biosynthesis isomerase n=1 Tax=Paenibacillus alvei TaxID=44250 RepID=UPI003D266E97